MTIRFARLAAPLLATVMLLGAGAAHATVDIRIDLTTQTMQVRRGGGPAEVWPVSTGRAGYVTPRGSYRPTRLVRMHYSRKYDNAPMPYSIFFKGGYAIHGTGSIRQLGRPASHGCVRLAPAHAARLFAMVKAEGARITLTGSPPSPRRRARVRRDAAADAPPAVRRTAPRAFSEVETRSGLAVR